MLNHFQKKCFRIRNVFHPIHIRRFLTSGDQILRSDNFISWNSKDPVKMHFRSDKSPDNYPPILVETMFRRTVERHPDHLAIVANRSGMDWNLKWTFERLVVWRILIKNVFAFERLFVQSIILESFILPPEQIVYAEHVIQGSQAGYAG